ncbi:MAG: hypothetical protein Q4G69_07945 [Planctomycetia bacterium]|nr:hypothetical protein [Planctomycetia bacterium]
MNPFGISTDLDELVRLVMSDLKTVGALNPAPAVPVVPASEEKVEPVLRLSDKLINVALIESKDDRKTRRWIVPRRAILTPLAKEELRKRKIELVYEEGSSSLNPDVQKANGSFLIALHGIKNNPTLSALLDRVRKKVPFAQIEKSCIIETTEEIARQLLDQSISAAVILSPYPAPASLLANRREGVRALIASDPNQFKADAPLIGANTLILNPESVGLFRMQQILNEFVEKAPYSLPGFLKGIS